MNIKLTLSLSFVKLGQCSAIDSSGRTVEDGTYCLHSCSNFPKNTRIESLFKNITEILNAESYTSTAAGLMISLPLFLRSLSNSHFIGAKLKEGIAQNIWIRGER
jgi:hypothetical protein